MPLGRLYIPNNMIAYISRGSRQHTVSLLYKHIIEYIKQNKSILIVTSHPLRAFERGLDVGLKKEIRKYRISLELQKTVILPIINQPKNDIHDGRFVLYNFVEGRFIKDKSCGLFDVILFDEFLHIEGIIPAIIHFCKFKHTEIKYYATISPRLIRTILFCRYMKTKLINEGADDNIINEYFEYILRYNYTTSISKSIVFQLDVTLYDIRTNIEYELKYNNKYLGVGKWCASVHMVNYCDSLDLI